MVLKLVMACRCVERINRGLDSFITFFIWVSIQVNITVKISRTKEIKKIDIEKGLTVEQLLKKINLKPDSVLVIRNNKPIPLDEELNFKQELDIIQVSSGG